MAEINESIWGPKEKWINIDANQPSGKPDNQILKGAWFEDPNRGTIEYGLSNDKLELETDWDNSLSYAGFGNKAPLSNIAWWYVGQGETNQLQQIRTDSRVITNFAIGSNGQAANNFYKIQGPTYSPAQRPWNDRWNCGAEFSSVSGYSDFIPWTQIPIKRIVLVPLVHGWSSDFESDGYYELGNYLDNHLQDRPYITTVSARVYYDRACEYNPETGTGTLNRIYIGEFNTAILEHSTYGDGYEDEQGNDETGIYQPLYGNSDRGPIMGPLVDRSLPGNQTSGVWCVPVANGFGLEWNKLSHSSADFVVDVNSNSRIYLDTNDYTKEQLREGMRQAIACYGMFFADGADEARFLPLDDNKMMLGILEDGLGNGKYSNGEDNKNQDQWDWDDLHENEYDPQNPPRVDPNDYDEDLRSELRVPLYAQIGGHTYITSGVNFQNAYEYVTKQMKDSLDIVAGHYDTVQIAYNDYVADPSDAKYEYYQKSKNFFETFLSGENQISKYFSGVHTNPIECVKSILAFPFDLTNYISSTAQDRMIWGVMAATSSSTPTSGDFNLVDGLKSQFWVPGGSCSYFAEYENFLDYTPYCSAELYIPYCGSVQIDPESFIGHDISVRYLVDWHTGACLAFVYRDNLIVDQISGQMGISIPMIAADEMNYIGSMFEGSQQLKHAKTSSIATTVSGLADGFIQGFKTVIAPTPTNIAQAVKTVANASTSMANSWNDVKSAEYDLNTKQLAFKQLTTATPMTSTGNEQICRLVIYRPTFIDGYTKKNFGDYGHTTGFACLKNAKLSGFTGLTVCSSVDLSGISQATEKEKAMISSALKGGVYIKATS